MHPCIIPIYVAIIFLIMCFLMYDILYNNIEAVRLLRGKDELR